MSDALYYNLRNLGDFALARACCRWPPSEARAEEVRGAAARVADWDQFLRVVDAHRVAGLVHHALQSAAVETPPAIAQQLAERAHWISRRNLAMTAESARLQHAFDGVGIQAIFLKGATLAQLAYGSPWLKHSRDIDVLVQPQETEAALDVLMREGYALREPAPAPHFTRAQRRAHMRHGKDFGLIRPRGAVRVELHWRPFDNAYLLNGVDATAPTQVVSFGSRLRVRTLARDMLFAYLCAHGAVHGWARLKWLADFNAFIAAMGDVEVEALYRHAVAMGAGLCAGQALLLDEVLLGRKVPAGLTAELQASRRLRRMTAFGIGTMIGRSADIVVDDRPFGTTRVILGQFLLGRGTRYFLAQCRHVLVSPADLGFYRLPAFLNFLHPLVRLPFWLWRHAIYRGRASRPSDGAHQGARPAKSRSGRPAR